ncbi:MAG: phage portal protein [Desulfobulbus sp.]|nr:phage portal protein [Desulfobulbus sp.]
MAVFPNLLRRGFMLPTRLNNSYDGAGNGRRSKSWKANDSGPTAASLPNLRTLRNRSRTATRNDPYAFSAIDSLVSNTIGTGITPKPRHPDPDIRAALQYLWDDWTEKSDADGCADFYGQQAMICRTMHEAGECFVRLRPRRPSDGLSVPLQLQVLEPEFVPHDKNELSPGGNIIRAGIEFNGIGQRVAYWMWRFHPNDGMAPSYNELVPVPADQVLHIFEPLRPGQLRGVPVLAPVLARLKSLDDFDDAVLFRQEVANLFAGFIYEPTPEDTNIDPATGYAVETDDDGFTPMIGLEPGTMQKLLPGEDVKFSDPPDAGGAYPDFMRQQLLAVAAGAGLPYETLTGDMRNVNDRVIRVALNDFRRRIEQRQWNVFVHQLCRPVRAAWLDAAVLAGAVSLPGYAEQRRVYLRTRWVPQGWPYLHPVQDVQARRMEVRSGFTSRAEVALRQGYDAEMIDAEQAADNARADSLGLAYESDARHRDNASEFTDSKEKPPEGEQP